MAAQAKRKPITSARMATGNLTSGSEFGDIVAYALNNNFDGVDAVLASDPEMINARKEESGITALMAASGRGLEEMVNHLLSKPGIEYDLVDDKGRTALNHAVLFPEIVAKIMMARLPNVKWSAPDFDLI